MSILSISIDGWQRPDFLEFPATLGWFRGYVAVSCCRHRTKLIRAKAQFIDDMVTLIEQFEDIHCFGRLSSII
ncbi:hypothetical protein N7451_003266 [Penicillium sp. IBT 35674x]|nr:hypothetical protein N7451_003266 [Penicillium sp. IBT 35674x]